MFNITPYYVQFLLLLDTKRTKFYLKKGKCAWALKIHETKLKIDEGELIIQIVYLQLIKVPFTGYYLITV